VERSLQSLFPLISRRFQSFSEATDAALDVLAEQLPGEIVLGQIEPGTDQLRVLEVRGASIIGIERGNLMPLAHTSGDGRSGPDDSVLEGTSGIDDLDADHLKSLGLAEWVALPLEMSNGAVVGIIAALSQRQGDYGADHVVLLGLAARMLAYEWERVRTRTELRELRMRVGAAENADPVTGLTRREGFLDLLDREWRLARRGTLSTMAVVFRVHARDEQTGSPLAVLALKDAAEALTGAVRNTDQIGRVGEMDLGVAMIGCDNAAGVEALVERFTQALRRVTRGRVVEISVEHRWSALGEAASALEALEEAERQFGSERALAGAKGSAR
jgi:GGDEF domain-containing protein